MMPRLKPFVGGFLLSKESYQQVSYYEHIPLPNGLNLWRDPETKWDFAQATTGQFVYIQGHWAFTKKMSSERAAENLLSHLIESLDRFEQALENMVGRHLIICGTGEGTRLYNDSLGNRTVYYSIDSSLVCSHLNLLLEHEPHRHISPTFKATRWAADYTLADRVRLLLPNFALSLDSREVKRFYPKHPNSYLELDPQTKMSLVESKFDMMFEKYLEEFDEIALALSGGMDSRFTLSLLAPFWSRVTTYTYGFPATDARLAGSYFTSTVARDFELVEQIVNTTSVADSKFIDLSRHFSSAGAEELNHIIALNTVGTHGYNLVHRYVQLFSGRNFLNVRGNAVEIFRRVESPDISFETLVRRAKKGLDFDPTPRLRELGYDNIPLSFGRGSLAHWELKNGKWLSEIQNEVDPAFDTLIPIASRDLLELLYSFPAAERAAGITVRDFIDRRAPCLNMIALNSAQSLYNEWRELKLREANRAFPFSRLMIRDRDSDTEKLLAAPGKADFSLPEGFFDPRYELVAIFDPASDGTYHFRITQRYHADKSRGYFEVLIRAGNKELYSFDGALTGRTINLTLSNIKVTDSIEFVIHPLKSVRNDRSWSNATKTTIDFSIEAQAAEQGAEIELYADL